MRFSEQWLRAWVDPPMATQSLVHQLTMAGLEVDTVEPAAPAFEAVVVGEVLSVEPHPQADRLQVCRVAVGGEEPLSVVCGAPNVRAGMKAPLARVGAALPNGVSVAEAEVKGVVSQGMLCSAAELGMAESSTGLLALPGDLPAGRDLREALGLDDAVIELDLTPNRGDCLSVAGVAREVGAITDAPVQALEMPRPAVNLDEEFPVALEAKADCPRYLGRVMRGVDPSAETPWWMRERLRRSGVRAIAPVVDVTNYVMLELGQPLHAFDLAKLSAGIVVRRARDGESLTLLDGTEAQLDPNTLVIADQQRPVALAGVMGGEDSGVTAKTTELFLESAFFAPEAVAGRARHYGLTSDAAHRFERGVDPELPRLALERATQLLQSVVGGEAGPITEAEHPDRLPACQPVRLRQERLTGVLGAPMDSNRVTRILQTLGMAATADPEGWTATPPSFRFDIAIEADLIEEVARIYGYERLPNRKPDGALHVPARPEGRISRVRVEELLVDRGYQQAITYSFVDAQWQQRLDPGSTALALANPLSEDMGVMRTSLWPGLLKALSHNQRRQQERVRLFEYGVSFVPEASDIKEKMQVAGVVTGGVAPEHWDTPRREVDFYDVKADVEAVLALTGRAGQSIFEPMPHPALHPGQGARIEVEGSPVGWLGVLHPALQQALDLSGRTVLFEVDVAALQTGRLPQYQGASRFPAIRRDLSIVVDEAVLARAVSECVRASAGELLTDVRLFDVYRGKGVETGRKSLSLGLILQESSRTLTDDEVNRVMQRVVRDLRDKLGASLRE